MTATASPTVKNHESLSPGLIESASVNSITDFAPSKFSERTALPEKAKDDFVNIFICHFIFYAVFCITLVIHILLDLGLASFIIKIFTHLIESKATRINKKIPSFA